MNCGYITLKYNAMRYNFNNGNYSTKIHFVTQQNIVSAKLYIYEYNIAQVAHLLDHRWKIKGQLLGMDSVENAIEKDRLLDVDHTPSFRWLEKATDRDKWHS